MTILPSHILLYNYTRIICIWYLESSMQWIEVITFLPFAFKHLSIKGYNVPPTQNLSKLHDHFQRINKTKDIVFGISTINVFKDISKEPNIANDHFTDSLPQCLNHLEFQT